VPALSHSGLRIRCTRMEDRAGIAARAFGFARQLGFDQRSCWEICIAVQELVSNLVRHAGGGDVELRSGLGLIEVIATDTGPGIPMAILQDRDNWARGLGAVRRLMHEMEISTAGDAAVIKQLGLLRCEVGTRILARRYLERAA
jgi:anti-sigma regulatory factor (Ser/Thr protein kinase)